MRVISEGISFSPTSACGGFLLGPLKPSGLEWVSEGTEALVREGGRNDDGGREE